MVDQVKTFFSTRAAKAWSAGLAAAAIPFWASVHSGHPSSADVPSIAGAFVIGLLAVFFIPNAKS